MLRKENAFSLLEFVVVLPSFVEVAVCSRFAVVLNSHKGMLDSSLTEVYDLCPPITLRAGEALMTVLIHSRQ